MFIFRFFITGTFEIVNTIAPVYLTNDLKVPKENLAIILALNWPIQIIIAFIAGTSSAKNTPFVVYFWSCVVGTFLKNYFVFVLFLLFPLFGNPSDSLANTLHI